MAQRDKTKRDKEIERSKLQRELMKQLQAAGIKPEEFQSWGGTSWIDYVLDFRVEGLCSSKNASTTDFIPLMSRMLHAIHVKPGY